MQCDISRPNPEADRELTQTALPVHGLSVDRDVILVIQINGLRHKTPGLRPRRLRAATLETVLRPHGAATDRLQTPNILKYK